MTSVLADTRAVIGYLCDRTKLSPGVLDALAAAERTGRLFVSAITLVEVRLEVAAGNLPQQVWDRLWEAVTDRQRHLTVLPVDAAVADALGPGGLTGGSTQSEQVIAATALAHELRLVSGV